jgi:hypothetical protein
MNHYEKLAAVIIRAIGCCVSVYALIGMIYNAVRFLFFHDETGVVGIYAAFTYAIVGVVLFALSKPLAALIGRKF